MRLVAVVGSAATALLILLVPLGYGTTLGWFDPVLHVNLAFAAVIGVLFAQSLLLFYLVGVAGRLRTIARGRSAAAEAARVPYGGGLITLGATAALVTMGAFLLGGAAHTGMLSPRLHGLVSIVAAALQTYALRREVEAMRSLRGIIDEVEKHLDRAPRGT